MKTFKQFREKPEFCKTNPTSAVLKARCAEPDKPKKKKPDHEIKTKELRPAARKAGIQNAENDPTKEGRDYKDEYKKFQSSPERIKYRSELVKFNRDKGTYGNGDKKDASHKGGKIVGFEAQSKNRGRAEASRIKKVK